MPMRPISKNCLMMSLRKTPASSLSRTRGRICSRAKRRTVAWKSCSSSESAVNAGGGVSMESMAGMSEAYSKEGFLAKMPGMPGRKGVNLCGEERLIRESTKTNYNLALPFHENSIMNPESLALFVGGERFSYAELGNQARRISGWLRQGTGEVSGRVGILASRTVEAYAGVLGTLWSGKAYVPINP